MSFLLKINEKDNVAVAIGSMSKGEIALADGDSIKILEDVAKAHKVAIEDIKKGENVIKYGNPNRLCDTRHKKRSACPYP